METHNRGAQLGAFVHAARERKGLSTRKLAEAIGTTHSYIHKLEAGWFQSISPENINRLAAALELDRQDLFALAGYTVPEGLPSFTGYLRSKYGEDMSEEAIAELASFFDYVRSKQDNVGHVDDDSDQVSGGRS